MNIRTPTLRRHASGQYIAKWGGRTHYFGRNLREARAAFADPKGVHPGALVHWQRWSEARLGMHRPARRLTVAELVERFLASLTLESRHDTEVYYRTSLRRFLTIAGRLPADALDEPYIADFRADLLGMELGAKTIAHDLNAVKRLWRWGSDPSVALVRPLNLASIRPPRLPRSRPEDMSLARIRAGLAKVRGTWLEAYLAVNYLGALRPSEVIRLAYGQGQLRDIRAEHGHGSVPLGAVDLFEHKMSRSTTHARVVLVSPEMLVWVRSLAPMPLARKRPSTRGGLNVRYLQSRYARACAEAGLAGWPHRLRDSAATHLLALGVSQADTDLVLGHAPAGELRRYGRTSERLLWESARRLTLR